MAAVTICIDFGAQKNEVWHCSHIFPIYLTQSDGIDAMIFIYWMLSFKLVKNSFTFIKRFFSSSSLSAIKVVSSAYLRLLMVLPSILIPAHNSSSLAFLMMCSASKLNKQGHNRQPCCTPFSILIESVVPYRVLAVDYWPTYRFLRRQIKWSGIPISAYVTWNIYIQASWNVLFPLWEIRKPKYKE